MFLEFFFPSPLKDALRLSPRMLRHRADTTLLSLPVVCVVLVLAVDEMFSSLFCSALSA